MINSHCFICAEFVTGSYEKKKLAFQFRGWAIGNGLHQQCRGTGLRLCGSPHLFTATTCRRKLCYGNLPVPGFSTVSLWVSTGSPTSAGRRTELRRSFSGSETINAWNFSK